jgi:hypothetical protein
MQEYYNIITYFTTSPKECVYAVIFAIPRQRLRPKRCLGGFIFTLLIIKIIKPLLCPILILPEGKVLGS